MRSATDFSVGAGVAARARCQIEKAGHSHGHKFGSHTCISRIYNVRPGSVTHCTSTK